jgi:hypothetical protein
MKAAVLGGKKLEVAVKNGRRLLTRLPADPRPAAELVDIFSGRLKRRCNGGDTVTETTLRPPQRYSWPIVVRRACR